MSIFKGYMPTNTLNSLKAYLVNYLQSVLPSAKAYIEYCDYTSGAVTNFGTPSTFEPLEMSVIEGFSFDGLSLVGNTVVNTSQSKKVICSAIISVSGNNNDDVKFSFFVDTAEIEKTTQNVVLSGAPRPDSISIQGIIELDTNSVLQIYCANITGIQSITLESINVVIQEV